MSVGDVTRQVGPSLFGVADVNKPMTSIPSEGWLQYTQEYSPKEKKVDIEIALASDGASKQKEKDEGIPVYGHPERS